MMYWLIGMAVTMAAAGVSLYYQGKALENPDPKVLGKKLVKVGWFWIGLAILYFIVSFFLPR